MAFASYRSLRWFVKDSDSAGEIAKNLKILLLIQTTVKTQNYNITSKN
jgi:hypothetical protein